MINDKALAHISNSRPKNNMEKLLVKHYALVYYNHDTKVFNVYDAKDPIECHDAVSKNPNMEYALTIPCSSFNDEYEKKKHFKFVVDVMPMLRANMDATRAYGAPTPATPATK